MSIHTMGGVNYHTRRITSSAFVRERVSWEARWELPTQNGGPTAIQMHGEWLEGFPTEMKALEAAREDFVSCAAEPPEPVNTEHVNDR